MSQISDYEWAATFFVTGKSSLEKEEAPAVLHSAEKCYSHSQSTRWTHELYNGSN